MNDDNRSAAERVDEIHRELQAKSKKLQTWENVTQTAWRKQWPCYGPIAGPLRIKYQCRADYDPFDF